MELIDLSDTVALPPPLPSVLHPSDLSSPHNPSWQLLIPQKLVYTGATEPDQVPLPLSPTRSPSEVPATPPSSPRTSMLNGAATPFLRNLPIGGIVETPVFTPSQVWPSSLAGRTKTSHSTITVRSDSPQGSPPTQHFGSLPELEYGVEESWGPVIPPQQDAPTIPFMSVRDDPQSSQDASQQKQSQAIPIRPPPASETPPSINTSPNPNNSKVNERNLNISLDNFSVYSTRASDECQTRVQPIEGETPPETAPQAASLQSPTKVLEEVHSILYKYIRGAPAQKSNQEDADLSAAEETIQDLRCQLNVSNARCARATARYVAMKTLCEERTRFARVLVQRDNLMNEHVQGLPTSDSESPYMLVILLGESQVFSPHLLEQGRDGGLLTAQGVLEGANHLWHLLEKGDDYACHVKLFLDIPAYQSTETATDPGVIRAFLDGFNEFTDFISVLDVGGKGGAVRKARAHATWHSMQSSCKRILLGGKQLEEDDALAASSKTHFFRRSNLAGHVTEDRLMGSTVLFYNRFGGEESEAPQSLHSATSSRSSPESDSITIRRQINTPSPAFDEPPPWQQRPRVSSRSTSTIGDPVALDNRPKGSLLAQYEKQRAGGHQANRMETITVPFNRRTEGSIAGSPASSDEDEPSAVLPHSAMKFVQRPTVYRDADGNTETASVFSSTVSPSSPASSVTHQNIPRSSHHPAQRQPSLHRKPSLLERMGPRPASSLPFVPSSGMKSRVSSAMSGNANLTPLGNPRG